MKFMYEENRKSVNAFVGCLHDCVYCKPSFQRQMKRQKNRCFLCYKYTPHLHLERLGKSPPKTVGDEFIFFPSSGDLAWASSDTIERHIEYAKKYSDRLFLTQSKSPKFMLDYDWPSNIMLGTTIETTEEYWFVEDSRFKAYSEISKAPSPPKRFEMMLEIKEQFDNKVVTTVEPILVFNPMLFPEWIESLRPDITYVGYDNHQCYLPEPRLATTRQFIEDIDTFTEVRVKTLREAWWETEYNCDAKSCG